MPRAPKSPKKTLKYSNWRDRRTAFELIAPYLHRGTLRSIAENNDLARSVRNNATNGLNRWKGGDALVAEATKQFCLVYMKLMQLRRRNAVPQDRPNRAVQFRVGRWRIFYAYRGWQARWVHTREFPSFRINAQVVGAHRVLLVATGDNDRAFDRFYEALIVAIRKECGLTVVTRI
jgi:hypothetical protein